MKTKFTHKEKTAAFNSTEKKTKTILRHLESNLDAYTRISKTRDKLNKGGIKAQSSR